MSLRTQAGAPLAWPDWLIVAVAVIVIGWWYWMTTRST